MRRLHLALLLASLFPLPVLAQGPSADWRTIETAHFRVHYPAESEAWARRAVARLESIRDRVAAEVGYAPPEVVDVIVSDPLADSNGQAFPFLGWPRMVLWTSPPGPTSTLGHYRDWSEILVVHEETHLVHMLRPSRNPARQMLSRLVPVGPILLSAPRWAIEGYATVVEGSLTGAGRPNSDLRAAVLRRWAQAGKLPSYARLASDSESWQGMSMAYLVGSAYLEWLEQRGGPGSLRNLWARMTARSGRSFGDAFEGVFGGSPQDLYDRFRAELTWRAMEAERLALEAGPAREGDLWQDLSWTIGDPAVSPDGQRLVIAIDERDRPARLVVWSTGPDEEAEKKWEERRKKLAERDPEDVPAVRTKPLPREPLHVLGAPQGFEPTTPRWMADGRSILFVRFEPDPEGFLHPDLFLWEPESGDVRRLTHAADLRYPDPSPLAADPDWAVAVRSRHGRTQIVRVDLRSGEVRDVTAPSVDVVYDRPRLSPDGRRVAFARHSEGSWRLVIRDLDSGAETAAAPPSGGTVASAAWSPDGRTVWAVVGDRGFIDLWAFSADDPERPPQRITHAQAAALAPDPTPDGKSLFYLSLEPDGLDLRRLELTPEVIAGQARAPIDLPAGLAPAIRPPAPEPPEPFALAEAPAGRAYGLGRQELFPFLSWSGASAGSLSEIGVRGGDVLGRLDWLLLGSLAHAGWAEGGAFALAWRGWPVEVGFHIFQADEQPSEQDDPLPFGPRLDLDRRGFELSAAWERQWAGGALRLAGRGLREEIEPDFSRTGGSLDRSILSLTAGQAGFRQWGPWRLEHGLNAHAEQGRTAGDDWLRYGGTLRLGLGHDDTGLTLAWRRDDSRDLRTPYDLYQLGGTESSLLPRSALAGLIQVPGLPFGALTGTQHEGQRADLRLGFLPVPLFYERHRLWQEGDPKGDWLSLAGLEFRWTLAPLPIGRIPGLDLRAGVAQVLDEPYTEEVFGDDLRWWLTVVWRP
jgi:WD40-like Beta Propeller Repeat